MGEAATHLYASIAGSDERFTRDGRRRWKRTACDVPACDYGCGPQTIEYGAEFIALTRRIDMQTYHLPVNDPFSLHFLTSCRVRSE